MAIWGRPQTRDVWKPLCLLEDDLRLLIGLLRTMKQYECRVGGWLAFSNMSLTYRALLHFLQES